VDLLLSHGYFLAEDAGERKVMKPYPPLGLLYISSHLKARGLRPALFDSTFRSYAEFAALVARERPRVVGLYCNLMTKGTVLRMAAECRRQGATVVLGGPEPANDPARYLEHGADLVVIGEGEETLAELLPRLLGSAGMPDLREVAGLVYRGQDGAVVRTAPRPLIAHLDAQPWPDRDAIDVEAYLRAWRERHGVGSL
jgi:anaerobic magnesium-protoporphyrin IX monomethyl ester cyclase